MEKGSNRQLYDWDRWLALPSFELRRGEHYSCSQSAICQQIRNAAAKRDLRVSIEDHEHAVYVLVHHHMPETCAEKI